MNKKITLLYGNGLNICLSDELKTKSLLGNVFSDELTHSSDILKLNKPFPLIFESLLNSNDDYNATSAFKRIKSELIKIKNNIGIYKILNSKIFNLITSNISLFDSLITTNYDDFLELNITHSNPSRYFKSIQRNAGRKFNYKKNPPIFHIHGDIYMSNLNLCLGYYGYKKYTRAAFSKLKNDLSKYNHIEEIIEKLPEPIAKFFDKDIHIVGFGLDECEQVIWTALTIRSICIKNGLLKNINEIVFYNILEKKNELELNVNQFKKYFEYFHIECKLIFVEDGEWESAYMKVIETIINRIKGNNTSL